LFFRSEAEIIAIVNFIFLVVLRYYFNKDMKIWINLNKKLIFTLIPNYIKYISRVIVSQYFMCNILWITDKWLLTLMLLRWRPMLFLSPLPFFVSSSTHHTQTHLHICSHTYAIRIRKSHVVLNDTYFIARTK